MPLNNTALNGMADWFRTAYPYVGLFTADPGATGANPTAHPRKAHGAPPATGSGDVAIPALTFTGGAAGGPVTFMGYWTALTGGTFGGGFALSGDQTSNAAGEYVVNAHVLDASSLG